MVTIGKRILMDNLEVINNNRAVMTLHCYEHTTFHSAPSIRLMINKNDIKVSRVIQFPITTRHNDDSIMFDCEYAIKVVKHDLTVALDKLEETYNGQLQYLTELNK